MYFCIIFLLGSVVRLSSGQLKNCKPEYNQYYRCLHQINDDYSDLRILNNGQWVQVENDVKQCFQQFSCLNPWGIEPVRNGRRSCFNTARNRLRNDLQMCVRNMYERNFDLPQEDLERSIYERYARYVRRLSENQLVCSSAVNKGQLMQCVRARIKTRSTKIRSNGNRCQQKQFLCDPKISDLCYDSWQRQVRPGLRGCIGQMASTGRLRNYKSTYISCVQQRDRFHPVLSNPDPNYQYFDYLQTVYGNIKESCPKRRG